MTLRKVFKARIVPVGRAHLCWVDTGRPLCGARPADEPDNPMAPPLYLLPLGAAIECPTCVERAERYGVRVPADPEIPDLMTCDKQAFVKHLNESGWYWRFQYAKPGILRMRVRDRTDYGDDGPAGFAVVVDHEYQCLRPAAFVERLVTVLPGPQGAY